MDKSGVEIRPVGLEELQENALQSFNRYQVTNRIKYKENDQYLYKDEYYVENWDNQKKRQVINDLQNCIRSGGFVAGAFAEGRLIGFANVEGRFFGANGEYLELPYIHVSCEYRNCGLGKKLFRLCCEKSKEKGARKLYIAANPSEETQQFYSSVGCVMAAEVNKEIFDREPLDIQLEIDL